MTIALVLTIWCTIFSLVESLMKNCSCAEGLLGETLSRFSIWSLYLTFVLAVGRFIRLQCADIRMRIPYENFPACDRCFILTRLRPVQSISLSTSGTMVEMASFLWKLIVDYRPYMHVAFDPFFLLVHFYYLRSWFISIFKDMKVVLYWECYDASCAARRVAIN